MSIFAPTHVVVKRDRPIPTPPILAVTVRQPGWGLTVSKSRSGDYSLSLDTGWTAHIESDKFHEFIDAVYELVNSQKD